MEGSPVSGDKGGARQVVGAFPMLVEATRADQSMGPLLVYAMETRSFPFHTSAEAAKVQGESLALPPS